MVTMAAVADLIVEKRKHILSLQWLLVVGFSYLIYFSRPEGPFGIFDISILAFIIINAGLFFIPSEFYQRSVLDFILVFVDIAFISLAIYLTGEAASDFYLFFFLVLMMASAGQNIKALMLGIMVLSGLYAFMVIRSGGFELTSAFLLRIPFLFIVGLFFGYLVYMQRVGQQQLEAESEFTGDLFEFGKALVQTRDVETLYAKIPTLINVIMGTDTCELALVEEERITRRVLAHSESDQPPVLEIEKSIHQKSFQSDTAELQGDLLEDSDLSQKEDFALYSGFRSYMGKSWKADGALSGLIAVYREKKNSWSAQDFKKFRFLTDQTVLTLQYVQLLKELEALAHTDGLTGLVNFRHFSERVEEEFSRAHRNDKPLSVILLDLDRFKLINDNWGHAVGDEVLQSLSRVLKISSRRQDVSARRGGDEFAVLLPEIGEDEVRRFTQRLLESVAALDIKDLPSFSISLGSATFPHNCSNISELLEHADQALYVSKAQGRACASHYADIEKEDWDHLTT